MKLVVSSHKKHLEDGMGQSRSLRVTLRSVEFRSTICTYDFIST